MLLVRRRAPEGGFFEDGDRAAGVFGVLATGFSVLLGFIVFLAFESYDQSRSGAEQEALVARAAGRERAVLPAAGPRRAHRAARLLRALGRRTASGTGCAPAPRATRSTRGAWRMFRTLQTVRPQTDTQQSAYDKWLDQTSAREEARQRPHPRRRRRDPDPRSGSCCSSSPGVIFVFMLFFADARRARGRPGHADRIGRRGDGRAAAAAATGSTSRSTTASAGCNRSRWSGRCGWSTRRSAPSASRCSCRATRVGNPVPA